MRLIAEHRNISDYENKSAKDLIKALRRSRHKFSKKDADKYRKRFYDIKNYRHLSELEIEEIRKKFNKLEKSLVIILILFIMKILIVIKSLI